MVFENLETFELSKPGNRLWGGNLLAAHFVTRCWHDSLALFSCKMLRSSSNKDDCFMLWNWFSHLSVCIIKFGFRVFLKLQKHLKPQTEVRAAVGSWPTGWCISEVWGTVFVHFLIAPRHFGCDSNSTILILQRSLHHWTWKMQSVRSHPVSHCLLGMYRHLYVLSTSQTDGSWKHFAPVQNCNFKVAVCVRHLLQIP